MAENKIFWRRHFDKVLYNLTSRGFQGFSVSAFALIFIFLKIANADPVKIAALTPVYSLTVNLFIICFGLFLGKTGFEKYLQIKNGGAQNA